jgi:hypothetical protein
MKIGLSIKGPGVNFSENKCQVCEPEGTEEEEERTTYVKSGNYICFAALLRYVMAVQALDFKKISHPLACLSKPMCR